MYIMGIILEEFKVAPVCLNFLVKVIELYILKFESSLIELVEVIEVESFEKTLTCIHLKSTDFKNEIYHLLPR